MSDKTHGRLATAACVAGGLAIVAGVAFPVVAAAQGSRGGPTALLGAFIEAPIAGFAMLLGLVAAILSTVAPIRRKALVGLGLGLAGPAVFLVAAALFVPTSAFRL